MGRDLGPGRDGHGRSERGALQNPRLTSLAAVYQYQGVGLQEFSNRGTPEYLIAMLGHFRSVTRACGAFRSKINVAAAPSTSLRTLGTSSHLQSLNAAVETDSPERWPLYLDAQSTTPLDPRVLDAMLPYLTHQYGNPHSRTHSYGWESERAVETARQQVADLIGADKKEIIFTSGATESNNISVKGVARFYKSKKRHVITTQTQSQDLSSSIHFSSGHKIYGPKGIGCLYVRRRPRVRVEALMSGGGQERGMRSGTVPTPLVVGLGAACNIALQEMEYDHAWDVALSSGSACTSASLEPSYVLRAIGAEEDLAHSSIRFGLGRFTTMDEVKYTADKCVQHVSRLREMSPLWEMVQEGIDLKSIQWSQH
ncbi:Cysteine desulfurase, mitochondrial [Portunus trituberculatus]|uniref:Cysteine desulfurase, mitochondrial n=1 Tax=Portunus trituberculatus TaxID=210409 RepID=A0A5B7D6A1_PORTR|nr:Cysteine desulfurase, mitochondrial [Portunus trituberculatus]